MKQLLWLALFLVMMTLACGSGRVETLATAAAETQTTYLPTVTIPAGCSEWLCPAGQFSLLEAQNRPLADNVLKLFSVAIDSTRNRVYVAGIMTSEIAILDASNNSWLGTVDSGIVGLAQKYLQVDPIANRLYVIDSSHQQLWQINLDDNSRSGPVEIPFTTGQAVVDSQRGRLYLTSYELPGFYAYSGEPLALLYTNGAMGAATGDLVYDEQADLIYILDSMAEGGERVVHLFDPAGQTLVGEIPYQTLPGPRSQWLGWNEAQQHLMVATARHVYILNRDGSQVNAFPLPAGFEMEQVAYDVAHQRIVALAIEVPVGGQVSGTGAHLFVFNPATGEQLSDLPFGLKPHRFVLDDNHLYIPNGDASVVWHVDTNSYQTVEALRLGDSLEQVVVAADGTLYLSSRLGGSYLVAYDPAGGNWESFEDGVWPIPIRSDPAGTRLFILNAWDSTLSVYSLENGAEWLGTIPLGLPAGSTDRLPDLTIDTTHHLAYAAYPEFGQIAVVDWLTMSQVAVITVEGFPAGEKGGGPGNLQLRVNEQANLLFAFWANAHRLTLYDGNAGYAPAGTVDLQGLNWQQMTGAGGADQLFFDQERALLYVGPFELDGNTGQPTGRVLAQGQRIFALDPASNLFWADQSTVQDGQQANTILRIDRNTLAVRDTYSLPTLTLLAPTYALDLNHNRLLVGDLSTATLEIYLIGQP